MSRLVSGTYRYAVVVADVDHDRGGDSLARSGAVVTVHYREAPNPVVFRVPSGAGSRWTVFEVRVDGPRVSFRRVDELDDAGNETAADV